MGWPIDRRMLPHKLHTFWNYREDLSMENGLITKGGQTHHTFHIEEKGIGADTWGTLWNWEMHAQGKRLSILAWNFQWHKRDCRKMWDLSDKFQSSQTSWKCEWCASSWHTLGTDLFYWNKIDYLVIGDYFSKYLIIRRLPNGSSHMVIKELGLVFTELGKTICAKIWQWTLLQFQGVS